MTKLEAWKEWCATAGTESLANQFTLDNSSHGKAFSFAWNAAHEACAKVCETLGVHPALNVYGGGPDWYKHGKDCADAIRSRRNA